MSRIASRFGSPHHSGATDECDLHAAALDPLLRAGIAHFRFVTLHPFEDGNGRLARAIADRALAQADRQSIRLYAMSAAILAERQDYYRVLEASLHGTTDLADWLAWFIDILLQTLTDVLTDIDRTLVKPRFWQRFADVDLSSEQVKVLNRLLDGGERGFEGEQRRPVPESRQGE